jgi:CheY-like chemotaxis protein
LVVDDDPLLRVSIAELLQGAGYGVSVASDGAAALANLAVESQDLILLDQQMSNMTGDEVLLVTRHDPRISAIPVIMLSTVSVEKGGAFAAQLKKPFEAIGREIEMIALPYGARRIDFNEVRRRAALIRAQSWRTAVAALGDSPRGDEGSVPRSTWRAGSGVVCGGLSSSARRLISLRGSAQAFLELRVELAPVEDNELFTRSHSEFLKEV